MLNEGSLHALEVLSLQLLGTTITQQQIKIPALKTRHHPGTDSHAQGEYSRADTTETQLTLDRMNQNTAHIKDEAGPPDPQITSTEQAPNDGSRSTEETTTVQEIDTTIKVESETPEPLIIPPTSERAETEVMEIETESTHRKEPPSDTEILPTDVTTTPARSSPREFSQEEIDELLAESSTASNNAAENNTATQSNSGTKRFPIWIHKKNFSCISDTEAFSLQQTLLSEFVRRSKDGLEIDLRFTSKQIDLKSGKIKMLSENENAPTVIKTLLNNSNLWEVLGPEDLASTEGQVLWLFCPPVLHDYVKSNSLCEVLRLHTGKFLDETDIRTQFPPKYIKDTQASICFLFLSYKAQRYYEYFNWHVSLICCTLKLTPFNEPRGTKPIITKDTSPSILVEAIKRSSLISS